MFITQDSKAKMGYIYLKEPRKNNPIWEENSDCTLSKYLEGKVPKIQIQIANEDIQKQLNGLTMNSKTYLEDLGIRFEEEWLNDKKDEYITGIELRLTRQQFIKDIENDIYRIYKMEWLERDFLFLTLDSLENIFEPNNIIYPADSNKDVFYVVAIEDEVCYIKAILSTRSDLYNIEYLKKPRFILYE